MKHFMLASIYGQNFSTHFSVDNAILYYVDPKIGSPGTVVVSSHLRGQIMVEHHGGVECGGPKQLTNIPHDVQKNAGNTIGKQCVWHTKNWDNLLSQKMDKAVGTSILLVWSCKDEWPLAQKVLQHSGVTVSTLGEG